MEGFLCGSCFRYSTSRYSVLNCCRWPDPISVHILAREDKDPPEDWPQQIADAREQQRRES